MVKKDLVTAKLADLAVRIARVEGKVPSSVDELRQDADALDIISFNLMLAVQLCADIASHIVSDDGLVPARTLAEGFGRLAEHGVLTARTAESLKLAVGLRNVVAHGYGQVDLAAIFAASTQGAGDLRAFSAEVATWLTTRP